MLRVDCPALVRAGMAHLNLVMVHPFRDGNGGWRGVSKRLCWPGGILSPVFCSIEEYLGRNTQAYYDVLHVSGAAHGSRGRRQPRGSRFILTAHLRQARTLNRRIKESERLWDDLENLVGKLGLPERTLGPLYDAAMRFRVRNGTYRAVLADTEDAITEQVASRDLRQLTSANLLIAHGAARGRYYVATKELADLRRR